MNKGLMCGLCLAVGAVIGYIWGKRVKNDEDLDAAVERANKEVEKVRQALSPDLSETIEELKSNMNSIMKDLPKIAKGQIELPGLEKWMYRHHERSD